MELLPRKTYETVQSIAQKTPILLHWSGVKKHDCGILKK